jgi:hypothetical protein
MFQETSGSLRKWNAFFLEENKVGSVQDQDAVLDRRVHQIAHQSPRSSGNDHAAPLPMSAHTFGQSGRTNTRGEPFQLLTGFVAKGVCEACTGQRGERRRGVHGNALCHAGSRSVRTWGLPKSQLNPPPGLSGRRAVRQSIHAALAPSLLPLSAFHAASSMPVVKQRVWMNSPPLVRYTLELIITYLIDPSFARSRAG